jgi:hypothetical protein
VFLEQLPQFNKPFGTVGIGQCYATLHLLAIDFAVKIIAFYQRQTFSARHFNCQAGLAATGDTHENKLERHDWIALSSMIFKKETP